MSLRDLRAYKCIDAGVIEDLINVLRRIANRLKGGKPGRKKGTTDRVARDRTIRIRELWASGRFRTKRMLARRLGCHEATVSRAIKSA